VGHISFERKKPQLRAQDMELKIQLIWSFCLLSDQAVWETERCIWGEVRLTAIQWKCSIGSVLTNNSNNGYRSFTPFGLYCKEPKRQWKWIWLHSSIPLCTCSLNKPSNDRFFTEMADLHWGTPLPNSLQITNDRRKMTMNRKAHTWS